MPRDKWYKEFDRIRNLGRIETPHAWAMDNADLLAEGLPKLLDLLTIYQLALEQIKEVTGTSAESHHFAKNALEAGKKFGVTEMLKGVR